MFKNVRLSTVLAICFFAGILSIPFLFLILNKIGIFIKINISNGANEGLNYNFFVWLAAASLAASFAVIGVLFSYISRQKNNENITVEKPIQYSIIVCVIGVVSSAVLMSLFVGGFLQGELFPNLSYDSFIMARIKGPDWGKLAFWSFVSGFSERFIPMLIDQFVEKTSAPPPIDGANVNAAPINPPPPPA
jgi:hypothetical protein